MFNHSIQTCIKPRITLCIGCGTKGVTIEKCHKCSKPATENTGATITNKAPTSPSVPHASAYERVYDVNNLIYAPENDSRPHTLVALNNFEISALLDTGAHATVLGYDCLSPRENSMIDSQLVDSNVGIRTADSKIHRAMGIVDAEYTYHSRRHIVRTIVMANASKKLLLGMDFMHAFDIRLIDWAEFQDCLSTNHGANVRCNHIKHHPFDRLTTCSRR